MTVTLPCNADHCGGAYQKAPEGVKKDAWHLLSPYICSRKFCDSDITKCQCMACGYGASSPRNMEKPGTRRRCDAVMYYVQLFDQSHNQGLE